MKLRAAQCFDKLDPSPKTEGCKLCFMFSDSLYKYLYQLFLVQVSLVSIIQVLCRWILIPLGETPVVANMIGGLITGSLGLGQIKEFQLLFTPAAGMVKLQTLGMFGIMMYIFLIGVNINLGNVKNTSKKAWVIGISTFIIPLAFNAIFYFIIKIKSGPYIVGQSEFPIIAIMSSTTSFHVVSCFLADLKILNTELGRLATSVSTISGMCSWIMLTFSFAVRQHLGKDIPTVILFIFSTFCQVIFILVLLRKVVIWIIKSTPKGETIKDNFLFVIILMILATAYIGECFGLHCFFGPMLLGLAIPDNGPPVVSALTDKLEGLVSGLLLPIYFFLVGKIVDISTLNDFIQAPYQVITFASVGFFGKIIGTIIPALYYQIPLRDAFTLGFILTALGTYDLTTYGDALAREYVTVTTFTAMVVNATIIAAIVTPLVRWLYNPARHYIAYKNHTIQNAKHNVELRILVNIYNEDNVPTIVNLLEASNPTRKNPIYIYLLHLIELHGRLTPLFIAHHIHDKLFDKSTPSDQIIGCFRTYEKKNESNVILHPFTTITPFVSAHNDICTLALDKRTHLIIIPFHKQWNMDGTIIESYKCRNINKNVLENAPCSVGILIDRRKLNHSKYFISSCLNYNVGVIFLGGPDDREALCYAMRMVEHPNIHLTVQRLVPFHRLIDDINEKFLDDNLINNYRLHNVVSGHTIYKEEIVKNGVEIVKVIRMMKNCFDLVIVGRRQDTYSKILSGLTEWNEYPELGLFGDMFASSDFDCNISALVVQEPRCVLPK